MAPTHGLNQADATPQLEATIQRKRRHAISDAERRMIRRRAASHPGKQQQIAEWYGLQLNNRQKYMYSAPI